MPKIPQIRKEPSMAEKLREANKANEGKLFPPHLIIQARAGSGKTTTLIEGLKKLKGIPSDHPAAKSPSDQQVAIWKELCKSQGATKIGFVAFNKSIAEELKKRVPAGCEAMTSHGLGLSIVRKFFDKIKIESGKNQELIAEALSMDVWQARKQKAAFMKAVDELVDLCKQNLLSGETHEELETLVSHYGVEIEIPGGSGPVFDMVPEILEMSKDLSKRPLVSFADMIWLPSALGLASSKYDLLLVDEAQDLNKAQQQLVYQCANRLILCGDERQAIYGFAGADNESMTRMLIKLNEIRQGCNTLPLTYTRRCGKKIVEEANKIVADFHAFGSNPPGRICEMPYRGTKEEPDNYYPYVEPGDMILCRTNAPLVRECLAFLKAGVKANIQGRDVGSNLIKIIEKIEKQTPHEQLTVSLLISALMAWERDETAKEMAKAHPSDNRLQAITDKASCLLSFCDDERGDQVPTAIKDKINAIFSDNKSDGIRLSSVHRAKGLEANRVFILRVKGAEMPHPLAKTNWEREQEYNLMYVAITRAINELVYVRDE